MPEFLRKLFGEKAMTFDEFKTAYDAQKGAKGGVNLANLTDGGYVSAQKFNDKAAELATATASLSELQSTVKKFDGVDVDALKKEAAEAQKKFDADLAKVRKDSAITLALVQARARNPKAARALLDDSKITLNADGTLSGLDVDALRKSDPYLFDIEVKKDKGPGFGGGAPAGGGKDGGTVGDEISSLLFGDAAK